ncbi:MAG: hypothetical protein AAGB22_13700, partial [Bacteroidota bacterium]
LTMDTIILTTGWSSLAFTTPYQWDGTSNLVVELCMRNTSETSNPSFSYTTVNYKAVNYRQNNIPFPGLACGQQPQVGQNTQNLPNIRFRACSTIDVGNFSFAWSPANLVSDPAAPFTTLPTDSLAGPVSLSVLVQDTGGYCQDTASITLANFASLDIAGPDTLATGIGQVQLSSTVNAPCGAGGTYSWTPALGLSDPNSPQPVATLNADVTYYLNYSDSCGCALTDSVFLQVASPPIVIDSIISGPSCVQPANSGSLNIAVSGGTSPLSYSIDSGATFQPGALFPGLSVGIYAVQVMDANGCLSAVVADSVALFDFPVIIDAVATTPACFGAATGSVLLTGGNGVPPYQWSIDGGATFVASNVFDSLAAGTYAVWVQDAAGCEQSQQATVAELDELVASIAGTDTLATCIGQ